MRKKNYFNDVFLKQFKSGKDFESFLSGLHERGIEQMLKRELDHHSGYNKHAESGYSNARNGYGCKMIKTVSVKPALTFPGGGTAA